MTTRNLAAILEPLVDALPFGVVVLDRTGTVCLYNRYEEHLARRRRADVVGRHFFKDVAVCTDVPTISGAFTEHIDDNTLDVRVRHAFALPFLPQPREVDLHLRSFEAHGDIYGLLVIRDDNLEAEQKAPVVNLGALVLSALSAALPAAAERSIVIMFEGEFQRARFPHRAVAVRGSVRDLACALDMAVLGAVRRARRVVTVEVVDDPARGITVLLEDDGPVAANDQAAEQVAIRSLLMTSESRFELTSQAPEGTTVRFVFARAEQADA